MLDTHNRPITPGPFRTLDEIKTHNKETGHHFFDDDTMRFFRSHLHGPVFAGRLFVTSEKPPHGSRRYTIRVAHDDGSISSYQGFMHYATRRAALQDAERLAKELHHQA